MAELGNIELKVDAFFIDSRISACFALDCKFNMNRQGDANCNLKRIKIDKDGKCYSFKKKE